VIPLERGAKTAAVEEAYKAGLDFGRGIMRRRGRQQVERDRLG